MKLFVNWALVFPMLSLNGFTPILQKTDLSEKKNRRIISLLMEQDLQAALIKYLKGIPNMEYKPAVSPKGPHERTIIRALTQLGVFEERIR